ncbi:hypothetical protein ABW19_dt0205339 [Dactylella cylindrospora]|nr:hypothetical protein ABW19_dt0205339 [Dactylella cylindrospora]
MPDTLFDLLMDDAPGARTEPAAADIGAGQITLEENMRRVLENSSFSDVTVLVGVDSTQKAFKLHSAILASHSDFFKVACNKKKLFKENISSEISLPEIHPDVFNNVIEWMYLGKYPYINIKCISQVRDLMVAIDFLGVASLKRTCLLQSYQLLATAVEEMPKKKAVQLISFLCDHSTISERDETPTYRTLLEILIKGKISVGHLMELLSGETEGLENINNQFKSDVVNLLKDYMPTKESDWSYSPLPIRHPGGLTTYRPGTFRGSRRYQ